MPTSQTVDSNTTLARTAMVAGEAFIPGASSFIAGNIGTGVAHFVGTGLAVAILAPSAPVLATLAAIGLRVNSYKHATTGAHLLSGVAEKIPDQSNKAAPAKGA